MLYSTLQSRSAFFFITCPACCGAGTTIRVQACKVISVMMCDWGRAMDGPNVNIYYQLPFRLAHNHYNGLMFVILQCIHMTGCCVLIFTELDMGNTTNGTNICAESGKATLSQSAYEYLIYAPIYTIVAVCYSLALLCIVLRRILWKKEWNFAQRFRNVDRKMITFMLESFFSMLHHREGILEMDSLEKGAAPTKTVHTHHNAEGNPSNKLSTMINTDDILHSKWSMAVLSVYVASVTSLALIVFWDQFIITRNSSCGDKMDCFFSNGSYINIDDFDCYWKCLNSSHVSCYKLTLDIPKALAEVAGILFLGFNGFTFLMFLKLLVADGIATQCFRIIVYLLLAVIEYSVVIGIIVVFVFRTLMEEGEIHVEDALITLATFMGVTTPWVMLLWALKKKKKVPQAADMYYRL